MSTPEPANVIRPLRPMRGSVPITAEMFTSTTDPLVLAFQTSAVFHDPERDPALTLPTLQRRWNASRRGAAGARRTLIDLAYWAEVRVRMPGGRFKQETRTSETRMTAGDLYDLAAEYTPSSLITCGGEVYVIGADHSLVPHRGTASGDPVPPGQTAAGLPPLVTRYEQAGQHIYAGRTGSPPVVANASSVHRTDDEKTCMHDEFWSMITTTVTPVDLPGRTSVRTQLDVAFASGWTPESLSAWIGKQLEASRGRISNRAGFVIAQLRAIPAPAQVATPSVSPRPEWCGADGADGSDPCDPTTRLRERVSDGAMYRCPVCNPRAQSERAASACPVPAEARVPTPASPAQVGDSLRESGLIA
jgi:hypothetical protein